MKESTKQLKFDQKAAELLGMTLEEFRALKGVQDNSDKEREAQAVLLFIEKPNAFLRKKCANCLKEFLTTYKFVSVCSTFCRVESLEKVGVVWNPLHSSDERWKRAQIPIEYSIPPEALAILLEIAKSQDQTNQTQLAEEQILEESDSSCELLEEPTNTVQQYNGVHKSPEPSLPLSIEDEFLAELELMFPEHP